MAEQESDPVMERIGAAIGLSRRGEREQARELFAAIWADIGPDGDPFHRCTLAHYAADAFIYRFRIPGVRRVALARLGLDD